MNRLKRVVFLRVPASAGAAFPRPILTRGGRRAFTLVELLVVMGIIALLAGLGFPALQNALASARSIQCAGNLHKIGAAITQAASDNNGVYPEIAQAASNPYPPGSDAKDLYDTLSPYGITQNDLKCPVDVATGKASAYTQYGSSYEWNPVFDDEVTVTPILYFNGMQIPINSSRVRLCTDFNAIHNGRMNMLYGDGHVRKH
jgi:prepilin-type processing-associated H-X9-DG protein/prepilin-type N-terminal cleavage/methylation domain-containing protein